eukprot:scaffold114182_cov59-Cyclotella_meneghiniana.AAC.2
MRVSDHATINPDLTTFWLMAFTQQRWENEYNNLLRSKFLRVGRGNSIEWMTWLGSRLRGDN